LGCKKTTNKTQEKSEEKIQKENRKRTKKHSIQLRTEMATMRAVWLINVGKDSQPTAILSRYSFIDLDLNK
jgi:hypothetical protein